MPKYHQKRPRLITLLAVLLIIQSLVIIFLGLNLLTNRWTFLLSWSILWEDLKESFSLILKTPGILERDEILFYHVLAFGLLLMGAGASLFAGLSFHRGGSISWIMSLFAQIATLLSGIGLYLLRRPSQSYWLIALGILMVLYLNYGDVRQWFLQSELTAMEESDGRI